MVNKFKVFVWRRISMQIVDTWAENGQINAKVQKSSKLHRFMQPAVRGGTRWMCSGHMGRKKGKNEKRQNWKQQQQPRSLWSKSHKEAGRCILLSRLFPDSWIRSFLTASNASLSPFFGDAQNPSSPWSQCKDKPENFMHQICFHKSEFATELKKLTNTLKPFFLF